MLCVPGHGALAASAGLEDARLARRRHVLWSEGGEGAGVCTYREQERGCEEGQEGSGADNQGCCLSLLRAPGRSRIG